MPGETTKAERRVPRDQIEVQSVAVHNIIPIAVDKLLLDPQNPRLASVSPQNSQDELLKVLWTEMAVDEVALSIAANGFFDEEPLVVIPDAKGQSFVVLEGNRRLAAVRVLRDDTLREKLKIADIPKLSAEQKTALDTLPASVYKSRAEIWQYYGFRHINGPQPWDPYSKAQFIAEVYENQKIPLGQVAESIGDRHRTVFRLYRGYTVLRQAEEAGIFNREDRIRKRFNFNYLYTALDQPDYQKFIGIDSSGSLVPNPVSQSNYEQLKELLGWLYGSKEDNVEPLITKQTADLKKLREVLNRPQALSALRRWHSLDKAHEVSIGDKRRFIGAVTAAKEALLQANGTVTTGYSGEDEPFAVFTDISALTNTIQDEMTKIRTKVHARSTKK